MHVQRQVVTKKVIRMKELVTEKRIYTKEVQTHAHTYFQLLFPLKGSMHLKTKTFNKTLKLDHLFLLTPHSLHTFNSTVRNEFLVIDIPENKMTSTWYR